MINRNFFFPPTNISCSTLIQFEPLKKHFIETMSEVNKVRMKGGKKRSSSFSTFQFFIFPGFLKNNNSIYRRNKRIQRQCCRNEWEKKVNIGDKREGQGDAYSVEPLGIVC